VGRLPTFARHLRSKDRKSDGGGGKGSVYKRISAPKKEPPDEGVWKDRSCAGGMEIVGSNLRSSALRVWRGSDGLEGGTSRLPRDDLLGGLLKEGGSQGMRARDGSERRGGLVKIITQ